MKKFISSQAKKIKFKNIGKNNQHEVTLINIIEHNVDIASALKETKNTAQSYAEKRLTYWWEQAKEYLANKGFKDTNGYFIVNEKEIVPSSMGLPLWAAIQEKDQPSVSNPQNSQGQSGEYIAALIDHKCKMLANTWPPHEAKCSATLHVAIQICELFNQLHLLDNIHPQYSAGKSRVGEAHDEKRKLKEAFGEKAKSMYKKLLTKNPKLSATNCSKRIHEELEKNNLGSTIPAEETIRQWLRDSK